MRKISIGVFLMITILLLIILPVAFLWFFSTAAVARDGYARYQEQINVNTLQAYNLIHDTFERGQDKVKSDLILADYVLSSFGPPTLDYSETIEIEAIDQISEKTDTVRIPVMRTGTNAVLGDFAVVDQIKDLVGSTATVFQVIPNGLLRISTNGERSIGTYIPVSSPVYKAVKAGNTFSGRAYVVDAWYLTAYKPIFNAEEEIIGAIYVGINEDQYRKKVLDQLVAIEIGKSGYVFIVDSDGYYILSNDNQRDGERIWDTLDANGVPIIQEIIKEGKNAEPGVPAEYSYFWKNPADISAREKTASLLYFEPWDWVVGTSAYRDDVNGIIAENNRTTSIVGIVGIAMGILITLWLMRSITKPINKTGKMIENISRRDLQTPETINTIVKEFADLSANIRGELLPAFHKVFQVIGNLVVNGIAVSETLEGATSQSGSIANDIVKKSGAVLKQLENLDVQIQGAGSAVSSINQTLENLSEKVESQSASVTETSSAIEEMTASIKTVARIALEKREATNSLVAITEDGSAKISHTSESIRKISDSIGDIMGFTKIINGIAAQTNLLAMNAAIEAAHAGDAGKGFAVVAGEIRSLAESAAKNAKSISTTLQTIGTDIQETAQSSQVAIKSFDVITEEVRNFVNAFTEITSSTSEISAGSDEMLDAVLELNNITQQINDQSQAIRKSANEINMTLTAIKKVSVDTIETFEAVGRGTQEIQESNDHILALSQENRENLKELDEEVKLFKL